MWIKVLWSIFIFYAFTKIGSYNIGIVFLLFFEIPNDAFTTLSQFSSLPVITQSSWWFILGINEKATLAQ